MMAVRVAPATEIVARCIPRQDGGWMVVTRKGNAGSSPTEIPEGTQIILRDGKAERPDR